MEESDTFFATFFGTSAHGCLLFHLDRRLATVPWDGCSAKRHISDSALHSNFETQKTVARLKQYFVPLLNSGKNCAVTVVLVKACPNALKTNSAMNPCRYTRGSQQSAASHGSQRSSLASRGAVLCGGRAQCRRKPRAPGIAPPCFLCASVISASFRVNNASKNNSGSSPRMLRFSSASSARGNLSLHMAPISRRPQTPHVSGTDGLCQAKQPGSLVVPPGARSSFVALVCSLADVKLCGRHEAAENGLFLK